MKLHPFRNALRLAVLLILLCLSTAPNAASAESGTGVPIQITSEDTRREGNLAIAQGNVVIAVGETTLYCDYAQFDVETKNVLVSGNVRIFRDGVSLFGDRAIYNLQTKNLMGASFRTGAGPLLAEIHALSSSERSSFTASKVFVTTDNIADPGYSLRARTVRFLKDDHTEYEDVTLYVGRVPVLWFPYLYQPAGKQQSFSIEPGNRGLWGAFVMTRFAVPLGANATGSARLDFMTKRGVGLGFDAQWAHPEQPFSWGRLRSYYVDDQNPGENPFRPSQTLSSQRYRLSAQDRTYLSDTVYSTVNVNLLSDLNVLRDFSPREVRQDPNPDSIFALTKWSENFMLTLEARARPNRDFDATPRLPVLALDLKRQPFLDSSLFYEGETSLGALQRKFGQYSGLTGFDTFRADSFHQWSFPKLVGNWLSLVPKAGIRGTHYERSVFDTRLQEGDLLYAKGGSLTRFSANLGMEASFKLSRVYESVESRTWGLDGLRHILQPFTEWSLLRTSEDTSRILQFDRVRPGTYSPLLDPTQFTSIDSLSNWQVLRLGIRNRLQTRRDEETFNWLEMESYIDANLEKPTFSALLPNRSGSISNLFNNLRWKPLPWVKVSLDTQVPLLTGGFTEFAASSDFQPHPDLTVHLGNRHLSGHPLFMNSNLISAGSRLRMNDNWTLSFLGNYNSITKVSELQQYSLDRDLRSWVASLTLWVRQFSSSNSSQRDVAVFLSLSLKDVPKIGIPLRYDNASGDAADNGRNR
jgi:LPS-assembly protein